MRGSCKACQSPKAGGSSSALQSSCGILVSSDTGEHVDVNIEFAPPFFRQKKLVRN